MKRLPKLRDYDDPNRKEPYGWDYGHGKDRRYPTFPTKKAKKEFKEELERKFYADRDAFVHFDPVKWRRYEECERLAGGIDALERAARQAGETLEFEEVAFSQAMAAKIGQLQMMQGVDVERVELHCNRYIGFHGDLPLTRYTQPMNQNWVNALRDTGHEVSTAKSHVKSVASVFNLAKDQGKITGVPFAGLTFGSERGEKVKPLWEAAELYRLLNHLWGVDRPLAGVYAILFLTGLRVSMITPNVKKRAKGEFLRKDMINVASKEIIIPPGIMKCAKKGLNIDADVAPANLWPWLEAIHEIEFPLASQTFNLRRARLCKKLGLKWASNVHRRSCASYYAALRGRSRASDLLGNTEEMVAEHYQVMTFRKKAEAYFRVLPPKA